jgi:hypothetical protein
VIFRNRRTPSKYIGYESYLYFYGLSLRRTATERLSSSFLKEIMYQSGIGYKSTSNINHIQRKRKSMNI